MKRWVGIDFGLKRTGVAISDPLGSFAIPVGQIENGKDDQATIQKIKELIQDQLDIKGVVLGLPIHLDGAESDMSERVRIFAEAAKAAFGVDVILVDERLTSRSAENLLKERDMKRKRRKEVKDTLSAALILQAHLDNPLSEMG